MPPAFTVVLTFTEEALLLSCTRVPWVFALTADFVFMFSLLAGFGGSGGE
jgi:hypothetical protein